MTLFLLILLVSCVGCLFAARRGIAAARPALVLLAVLAIGCTGWMLYRKWSTPTSAERGMDAQGEAARVLGEQLAAQVSEGKVLVLTYAPLRDMRLFTDARLDGLRSAVTGQVEWILAGPLIKGESSDPAFREIPLDQLASRVGSLLEQDAGVKAIVSLLPYLPAGFQTKDRPLFAFAVHEMPQWQESVRSGACKMAMVAVPSLPDEASMGRPQLWSDLFEPVTKDTLDAYRAKRPNR